MLLAAGRVWHYWIGVPLAAGAVAATAATFIGYFRKMNSLKHPKR
jgi:hypothetical protein